MKAEKCEFHQRTVTFLGYVISPGNIEMDRQKVKAVLEWPPPSTRKELQSFLGFANFYRRFIKNYGSLAAPLTALTSTAVKFIWSSAAEGAFRVLKQRFTSAPILIQPNPGRQFIVEVDASDIGVGTVLSQRSASDNKTHPCAFYSHHLMPTEQNYDVGKVVSDRGPQFTSSFLTLSLLVHLSVPPTSHRWFRGTYCASIAGCSPPWQRTLSTSWTGRAMASRRDPGSRLASSYAQPSARTPFHPRRRLEASVRGEVLLRSLRSKRHFSY